MIKGYSKAMRVITGLAVAVFSAGVAVPEISLAATNQWSAVTPSGVTKGCAVEVSPNYASDSTVFEVSNTYGSTYRGVYKTTDKGVNWSKVTASPITSPNCTLAVSPAYASDSTLFTAQAAISYKSTDGGSTWTGTTVTGISDITKIMVSPNYASDSTVFAFGLVGVYKSTDGGSTWTQKATTSTTFGGNAPVNAALSPNYASDSTIVVGTGSGVYTSINGGSSWSGYYVSGSVAAIAFSPTYASDGILFVGGNGGVWKIVSLNWSSPTSIVTGLPTVTYPFYNYTLQVSPYYSQDKTLYAGVNDNAYRSYDSGAHWTVMSTGFTSANVLDFATVPAFQSDRTMYAATESGFYKQTLETSWSSVTPSGVTKGCAVEVSPNYASDSTVFEVSNTYSTTYRGVYKSTNKGSSWTKMTASPITSPNCTLALSPNYASDSTLFTAQTDVSYKSTDGGSTWTGTTVTGISDITKIVLSPNYASDSTVFAVGLVGVYKSTDGGSTWTQKATTSSTFGGNAATSVAISPSYASDSTVVVGTGSGAYTSVNGGSSWSGYVLSNTISFITFSTDYANDHLVFAGGTGGVWKVTSMNWSSPTSIVTGLPTVTYPFNALSLVVSPRFSEDHQLFIGVNETVYRSNDSGSNWVSASTSLPAGAVVALAMNPNYQTERTLFAGTEGGFLKASWY